MSLIIWTLPTNLSEWKLRKLQAKFHANNSRSVSGLIFNLIELTVASWKKRVTGESKKVEEDTKIKIYSNKFTSFFYK